MPQNPVAVTTIVSTDMVTAVANKYGVELRRVLTGFKYIGEQIALLEAGGHPERYIFGFEESYGYLSGRTCAIRTRSTPCCSSARPRLVRAKRV